MTLQKLRVSADKRHLVQEDGTPFFWLGDTAWELFLRLNREEADRYLRNRAERGFTVIQAIALGETDMTRASNAYGKSPLLRDESGECDPTLPDLVPDGEYGYWDHVDYIVDRAAHYGLYIGMLPTWGDRFHRAWGGGPEVFTADNAAVYGRWLGSRYRSRANIIWILGGDRPLANRRHFGVIQAMAEALREAGGGAHLMTLHPDGGHTSSAWVHEEEWLDFNMIQSGHGANVANEAMVASDYALVPPKPVLDAEPCYEDHPVGFNAENGFFDAKDVRQAAYRALFAGAFGHTYGHHCVWPMITEPTDYFIQTWQDAIMRPGAAQMQYVKQLMTSRPMLDRVPDQSLLARNYKGSSRLQACRGHDYAFIYSANGLPITVRLGVLSGAALNAHWYDPRSGEWHFAGTVDNQGEQRFDPPSCGRQDDWVLVLDGAGKGYLGGHVE
ncbi:glycoside hydrolase family 140 protein [Paenibacillus silvisoli]|uniref:glycoside hydrolase family 140 protein n=1 Tax=Paenibacillus silvisoli TaxID=3110539 RepID=UPI00280393CA|nr:glycoside hydrolase family 140 protein [Paenibacillus silvisoli]